MRRFHILDTPPEAAFERLTRLAARLFNVPVAIIKLIGEDRQWLKSSCGLAFIEPERGGTLGDQDILTDEVLVVPDITQDARFAQNTLVTGETAIRFYAGAPLHTAGGYNIGTFAIMGQEPRQLSEAEISALSDLAALAVEKMELRLTPHGLHETGQERRTEDLLSQVNEDHFRSLIENAADIIGVLDTDGTIRYQSPSIEHLLGYAPAELGGKNAFELIHPDDAERLEEALTRSIQSPGGTFVTEYRFRHRDGSWRILESVGKSMVDGTAAAGVVLTSRDITERKEAEANRAQLAAIVESSQDAIIGNTFDGTIVTWNAAAQRIYGYSAEEAIGQSIIMLMPSNALDEMTLVLEQVERGESVEHYETRRVRRGGQVVEVSLSISPVRDLSRRITGLSTIARDITERKQAEERIERQVQRIKALRNIDLAITASLDLRVTLNVLLDQVTGQLRVDAADVLLLNPHTQTMIYAAGRGFRSVALQHTHLRLGEGHAGRVALERHVVNIPNLAEDPGELRRAPLLTGEGFIAYYGVPLIAKGKVVGVLEVFQRASLEVDMEWLEFLDSLAGQAAIAIDNASLFDDLQRSNTELILAYDTTIEGWSRALDLRDKETEGHTQRVAEKTVLMARALGLSDGELVHIRRGALLHDIGKMGIPDSILLKPGPLTDEEWIIMRRHPIHAYELLSPISYLRPALDIPYCHHEKWDGTGYPRGLKGEQIPLSARIFAVADVWDALKSDRPYRAGWPEEQVLEYLQQGDGTHFDPRALQVFMDVNASLSDL